MPSRPLLVLADDLTGAAEIAAIAHQAGLRVVVHTMPAVGRFGADLVVGDTNTRHLTPRRAARVVAALMARLQRPPRAGFFKKTDSVLRGPVLAELAACAAALGRRRTLLVPCNPSLGRVIRAGHYFIGGQPLHRTAFARDPTHPRRTSSVLELLGAGAKPAPVCLPRAGRLPATGVIVGEAASPGDVMFFASQTDHHTLPAGGADFFRAWLQGRTDLRPPTPPAPLPVGATLLLSGTATPTDPISPLPGPVFALSLGRLPTVAALAARLRPRLTETGFAALAMPPRLSRDPRVPARLQRLLIRLALQLRDAAAFSHLIIAGGATASGVLHAFDWTQFEVARVWGPGVVTLQPRTAPGFVVTLKPGSYAWPAAFTQFFSSTAAAPAGRPRARAADRPQ